MKLAKIVFVGIVIVLKALLLYVAVNVIVVPLLVTNKFSEVQALGLTVAILSFIYKPDFDEYKPIIHTCSVITIFLLDCLFLKLLTFFI